METSKLAPDIAGSYAKRVQELLEKRPGAALTVPEILAEMQCTERRVREGLDRLVFQGIVDVRYRRAEGKRGQPPREYFLRGASAPLNGSALDDTRLPVSRDEDARHQS